MKYLILLFTPFLLFSRETIDLQNKTNFNIEESRFYVVNRPEHNFYWIILPSSLNTMTIKSDLGQDEQIFSTYIELIEIMLKNYDFKNNIAVGIVDPQKKKIFGNIIIKINQESLKKIASRKFEYTDTENTNISYPLRKLFEKAEILTVIPSSKTADFKISDKQTKAFRLYLKKHVFNNYFTEVKVEEKYRDYALKKYKYVPKECEQNPDFTKNITVDKCKFDIKDVCKLSEDAFNDDLNYIDILHSICKIQPGQNAKIILSDSMKSYKDLIVNNGNCDYRVYFTNDTEVRTNYDNKCQPDKKSALWKIAYQFKSSSSNSETSRIECLNGKGGSIEYFYNDTHYYVGGVFNRTFEDAANYICGNK